VEFKGLVFVGIFNSNGYAHDILLLNTPSDKLNTELMFFRLKCVIALETEMRSPTVSLASEA
jgi:hypothetical protein